MTNQQGAPEALFYADALDRCAEVDFDHIFVPAAAVIRRLHAENQRLAALVEAQQPAKADSLRQILTDPENQPNQYGVQFLMHGAKMAFRIGNRQFCLDYEPDEPGEFEFMRDALISAFSIFTPDVKMAQQPATHVQNPAEIEHVAGDVSKNGAESNMAQQPAPSAAASAHPGDKDAEGFHQSSVAGWKLHGYMQGTKEGIAFYRGAVWWHSLAAAPQPSPTPQADSQPAPDERDDFEKVFPLPSGCIRCGAGYASTGYSNWAAHTHVERWKGWQARAASAPADSVTAPAYSIDADPQGIRARVAEAITGALAFGAQGANMPPTGHWLAPFWESARWDAIRAKPVHPSADTLYLLRRLLSNQHTLTGSEFRAELGKSSKTPTQSPHPPRRQTACWRMRRGGRPWSRASLKSTAARTGCPSSWRMTRSQSLS